MDVLKYTGTIVRFMLGGHMKKFIITYIRNNKKQTLRYVMTSLVIAISLIFISYYIISMIYDKHSDKEKVEDLISNQIAEEAPLDEAEYPNGKQQDPDDKLITPAIEEDVIQTEKEEVVPPEDMDPQMEPKDPQVQGNTGVELDVTDLDRPVKEEEAISYGIDVAKWQGIIDWKKVKESGIDFAMIRVGYRTLDKGEIVEDPYAKYNLQEAVKNDILIGVYFFSTAINEKEAREEAAWVADFIAPYPITYPVAYNCEGFTDPNNRQYGMSEDERTDLAIEFLDYIKEEGYNPMFYAAKSELEQNAMWNTDRLSQKYKIWVAQYPELFDTETAKSSYSGKHAMWQYTSKGNVPGIGRSVDLNIAYFKYKKPAKAKKDTPQETVTADPAALIDFEKVDEIVTAKIETNLRSVPSTKDPDTVVAVLKNGDTAKRTGIGNNGWSRLEYRGQIVYAVTSYLSTNLEAASPTPTPQEQKGNYKKVNEKVTAKDKTNLRSEPSTKSEDTIVEVLHYGDIAIRTGIGDNGWSRVEYKGQTLYAVSSYLTTDLNYQENSKPTIDNPEAGVKFKDVNEQVTAKEFTNLRLVPSSEDENTIAAVLYHGDIAIRTGIGENGWSRLEYNGQILYAVTNYLVVVE